ncbi:MAG: 3D domain-containing protein [Clostridia bacterium]|nr:3D domain-containing protein [Clostridia bacterium]
MKKWSKVRNKKGTGYVPNKTLSKKRSKAIKIANKKASNFKLTGYCSCYDCSEGWGTQTKSGRKAKANHTIASDLTVLPLYTEVYIKGMGTYTVEDKGGGVKGKHIDVYCNKHSQCYDIQSQAKVFVIE